MDINQVRFGNYTVGNPQVGAKKSDAKQSENAQAQASKENVNVSYNPSDVLNAMDIAGLAGKAQINFAPKAEINPADYLSDERIADIEAMMAGFENGVNAALDVIDEEFPGLFDDAQKYALAAQAVAQE